MFRSSRFVRAAAISYFCVACSSSAPPAPSGDVSFSTTPLGEAPSTSGAFQVAMYPATTGLVQGLNTIEIVVTDAQAVPADGLAITLQPWMPSMGHGASTTPTITPKGSGQYVATNVALIMPGSWQLRTTVAPSEQAVVAVAVP
jgi:hypothetical protein